MVSRLDVAILIACLAGGAVVAVPRHVRLAADTRVDEVESLARSANLAAQLAHARWQAGNEPPTIEGVRGLVAMNHGYPSAATLPLMLADAETNTFIYADGVWRHRTAGEAACGVAYSPPAAPGQNPAITALTQGC